MSFTAMLSGPDMAALTASVIEAVPYARGMPVETTVKWVPQPPADDWREQLLADDVDALAVGWGGKQRISRDKRSIAVTLPDVQVTTAAALGFLAPLPFELAVLPCVRDYWPEHDYYAPAIGADHGPLGWGILLKGAGHERSLVSRRWLAHGPFRTVCGPDDTTLVQFHDLAADGPTSLAQAAPGHQWIVGGFLRPKHPYRHDIEGVYTKEDGLLRIVVHGRTVDDAELVDACAARRDGRDDPERPIRNVAYVFVDEAAARDRIEALWLRELECRVVDGRGERRLDDTYAPSITKPGWVTA